MSNFFSSSIWNIFLLLAIMNTFYHDDADAIHSPLIYENEDVRYSHTSYSADGVEPLGGNLRYGFPQNPTVVNFKELDYFKEIIESLTPSEKRDTLAYLLKQRYREFRKKLEETSSLEMRPTPQPLPKFPSNWSFRRKPVEEGSNSPILTAATFRESNSLSNILKPMRSADESPSPIRSSGLKQDAHPFPVATLQGTPTARTQSYAESVLDDRLGPSAKPKFDPSIVVDFHSLLQLTRRLQRLQKAESSKETGVGLIGGQVYVQPKSGPNVRVFRRKLTTISTKNEEEKPKRQLNRAKVLQMPTNSHFNSSSSAPSEDFSMFISMGKTKGSSPIKASDIDDNKITNEFGPLSQGNDPTAGIHPSQVSIPDIDLMQLRLPQGVRDTLRNYLKPIISGLKPLRKNVPGLPGLDYPILSVVPYTNFYCSNMPWPGFYADTEARCQTWHACDVDGRQSTFLCPNGTVFNQALMVCDWWYNVDCLVTKYLYPLNERLFGTFKIEDTAKLQTRITPELLDTIFVS